MIQIFAFLSRSNYAVACTNKTNQIISYKIITYNSNLIIDVYQHQQLFGSDRKHDNFCVYL